MSFRTRWVSGLVITGCMWSMPSAAVPADGVPTVEELIDRVATDWEPLRVALTATMTVSRPHRPASATALLIRRAGSGRTRVDFLDPPEDRGKIILQAGERTWLYLPRPDRVVEVPPRRSPLAGGVLFEDLFPGRPEMAGASVEERGREWVLVVSAPPGRGGHTSRIYFDQTTLLPVRREVFASSGRVLRTVHIEEMRQWNGVEIPWDVRFIDYLRKGNEIRIVIHEVSEIEEELEELFSKERLGAKAWP